MFQKLDSQQDEFFARLNSANNMLESTNIHYQLIIHVQSIVIFNNKLFYLIVDGFRMYRAKKIECI